MDQFKFKIGDIVTTKVSIAEAESKCLAGNKSSPKLCLVVERLIQECPGGIQRHYLASVGDAAARLNEIEVADPATFDHQKWHAEAEAVAARLKAEARVAERKHLDEMFKGT